MRLIDADETKKVLLKRRDEIEKERRYGWEFIYNAFNDALLLIGRLAITNRIDAVPVIRCKDCKHWKSVVHYDVAEYGLCNARTVLETEPRQGFCHRAERRAE